MLQMYWAENVHEHCGLSFYGTSGGMSALEFKTQKTPSKTRFNFLITNQILPSQARWSLKICWILCWKNVLSNIQNLLSSKMSRKQTMSLQYFLITDRYSIPINNIKPINFLRVKCDSLTLTQLVTKW